MLRAELDCRAIPGPSPRALKGWSRNDLPEFFARVGFKTGAEIGVWEGAFTEQFCKAGMQMLAVDPWKAYPEYLDHTRPDLIAGAYETAGARLAPYGCEIYRDFSAVAAPYVDDGSLDFVYIDGNHSFFDVVQDLTLWAPKVRSGGIICGHDYRQFRRSLNIRVVEAVNAYTLAHDIDPWYVLGRDRVRKGEVRDRERSFLWVQP